MNDGQRMSERARMEREEDDDEGEGFLQEMTSKEISSADTHHSQTDMLSCIAT